jgi:CRP-like cAMP-binding protein
MFEMAGGRVALMDALRKQFLVDGRSEIAEKIASVIILREYDAHEPIFTQGERGGDICLILSGKASIHVDGREVAIVSAGMHVGEIGMLDPGNGRSATVVALDTVVAAHIPQARFIDLAKSYPELWRRLALELVHRLVNAQRKG